MIRGAVAFLAAALPLAAQMQLDGVVSGFVFDEQRHALRPILGAPGAARLGEPVALPFAVRKAAVRGVALVISDEQPARLWMVSGLRSPYPSALPIADALADPEQVFLNKSGTAALVYSSASETLQLIADVPSAPRISAAISSRAFRGRLSTAAIDDAGKCALIATVEESTGFLARWCVDQAPEQGFSEAGMEASAVAFVPGRGAAVLDRNRLLLVDTASQPWNPAVLAEGIMNAVGLHIVSEREALVASAAPDNLIAIDLGTGAVASTPLPEAPTVLEPLGNVLACSRPGKDALFVVDLERERRVFYVPSEEP